MEQPDKLAYTNIRPKKKSIKQSKIYQIVE